MGCNSFSALLLMVNRKDTVSNRKMERDHLRVHWCLPVGVKAKSELAFMNESETKRGNACRLLCVLSSSFSLV